MFVTFPQGSKGSLFWIWIQERVEPHQKKLKAVPPWKGSLVFSSIYYIESIFGIFHFLKRVPAKLTGSKSLRIASHSHNFQYCLRMGWMTPKRKASNLGQQVGFKLSLPPWWQNYEGSMLKPHVYDLMGQILTKVVGLQEICFRSSELQLNTTSLKRLILYFYPKRCLPIF